MAAPSVLPTLPNDLAAMVSKHSTLAPGAQIGLFCYGDHNREIFVKFASNIIPEGHSIPLSEILLREIVGTKEVTKELLVKKLVKHKIIDDPELIKRENEEESEEESEFDEELRVKGSLFGALCEVLVDSKTGIHNLIPIRSKWLINLETFNGNCMAIRFTFNKRKYILADTYNRHDYRKLHKLLIGTINEWKIHHTCLITHCLKCDKQVDPNLWKRTHEYLHEKLWEPACAGDVMCVMYQTQDDKYGSLWNALTE